MEDIAEAMNAAANAAMSQTKELHQACLDFSKQYRRDLVMEKAIRRLKTIGDQHD